jgi:hypothetical protein
MQTILKSVRIPKKKHQISNKILCGVYVWKELRFILGLFWEQNKRHKSSVGEMQRYQSSKHALCLDTAVTILDKPVAKQRSDRGRTSLLYYKTNHDDIIVTTSTPYSSIVRVCYNMYIWGRSTKGLSLVSHLQLGRKQTTTGNNLWKDFDEKLKSISNGRRYHHAVNQRKVWEIQFHNYWEKYPSFRSAIWHLSIKMKTRVWYRIWPAFWSCSVRVVWHLFVPDL